VGGAVCWLFRGEVIFQASCLCFFFFLFLFFLWCFVSWSRGFYLVVCGRLFGGLGVVICVGVLCFWLLSVCGWFLVSWLGGFLNRQSSVRFVRVVWLLWVFSAWSFRGFCRVMVFLILVW